MGLFRKSGFLSILFVLALVGNAALAAPACRVLFQTPSALGELFENNVYAVHITDFLPQDGKIRAVSKDRGRFAATIHFSLGEPVIDHPWGNWSNKPYAVVFPVKFMRDQILNLLPQDTFVLGDVQIPKEAVIFIPSNERIPSDLPCRAIQYDPSVGVKPAIKQFLKDIGSIEFTTKGLMQTQTIWRKTDIQEGKRLERLFRNLFQDKSYLTRTTHDYTAWGKLDYVIIDYLANWISGLSSPKELTGDLKLIIYSLQDSLTAISRVAAQMTLPDYALASYKENLRELKSYLNLLEAEQLLRQRGLSMLALDPKANSQMVQHILMRRYNREDLFKFVRSSSDQLAKIEVAKNSDTPEDYLRSLPHTPIEVFKRRLIENFQSVDNYALQSRISAVTALHAFAQVKAGLLKSQKALPYFLENKQHLTDGDILRSLSNTLYEVVSDDFRKKAPLNKEILKFLGHPQVHAFFVSRGAFNFFDSDMMLNYQQRCAEAAIE